MLEQVYALRPLACFFHQYIGLIQKADDESDHVNVNQSTLFTRSLHSSGSWDGYYSQILLGE